MNKNDKIDNNFKTDINRKVLNHTCNRVIYTDCNRDKSKNVDTVREATHLYHQLSSADKCYSNIGFF